MSLRVDLGVCMAHPDDECLAAGAWMADVAAQGKRVSVFLATAGDAAAHPELSSNALGDERLAESRRALALLGVEAPVCARLPDGQLSSSGDELDLEITRWLETCRPKRVVTYGRDGGYGHVDHLTLTTTLLRLAKSHPFELWQSVFRPGTFDDLRRFLQRHSPGLLDEGAFDDHSVSPEVTIDREELFKSKRLALESYVTQLQGRPVDDFLGKRAMRKLLSAEHFARLY